MNFWILLDEETYSNLILRKKRKNDELQIKIKKKTSQNNAQANKSIQLKHWLYKHILKKEFR